MEKFPTKALTPARKLLREIAHEALMWRLFDSRRRRVGEFITKLPTDKRDILETLTSDDVKNELSFNALKYYSNPRR